MGDRLAIESLTVQDECAARLVRERAEAGDDPAKTVTDAIEIGARVLDREHAAANAEFVKTEFERASRQLEGEFTDKARRVAEFLGGKVDEVFGPENGHLARELDKLFSDGSAASVQNRVRELVADTLARSREDLVRQFSTADGSNPLADFKRGALESINQAAQRSDVTQRALLAKLGELERQLQSLRDEKGKLEELEAERERGTAKGRSFEGRVAAALDAMAHAQGDVADAVGDLRGASGRTGDVVVSVEACNGPPLGRIVFEAKDRRLSRPRAVEELDRALSERDADFAVLVVPTDDEVPARMQPLREYGGDKLIVTLEAEDGGELALELGYRLARARVLMRRTSADGVDAAAVEDASGRARAALEDVRRVKSQLSGARTSIENARKIVDAIAAQTRAHLDEIDALVRVGSDRGEDPADAEGDGAGADPDAATAPDAARAAAADAATAAQAARTADAARAADAATDSWDGQPRLDELA
ncbi:MAG: hypothetical protein ACM3UV_00490 [Nocardioidaceae bacterium]